MSGGGSPGRLMGGPGGETGGGGSLSSFSPCSRSSVRGPCSAASTCRRRGKRGVKVNAVFMSSVCFINKKNGWKVSLADCRDIWTHVAVSLFRQERFLSHRRDTHVVRRS